MDKNVSATIVIVVLLVILAAMALSWRRRKRRQGHLDLPVPVPAELGAIYTTADGLYLATTPAGDRLNRIAVAGLGFRARLGTVVAETGIVLPFPGASDVFIPISALISVGTASFTIDRGIEPDGLTVVSWNLGSTAVDSYFRFDEPAPFVDAVRQLLPAQTGSDNS